MPKRHFKVCIDCTKSKEAFVHREDFNLVHEIRDSEVVQKILPKVLNSYKLKLNLDQMFRLYKNNHD